MGTAWDEDRMGTEWRQGHDRDKVRLEQVQPHTSLGTPTPALLPLLWDPAGAARVPLSLLLPLRPPGWGLSPPCPPAHPDLHQLLHVVEEQRVDLPQLQHWPRHHQRQVPHAAPRHLHRHRHPSTQGHTAWGPTAPQPWGPTASWPGDSPQWSWGPTAMVLGMQPPQVTSSQGHRPLSDPQPGT